MQLYAHGIEKNNILAYTTSSDSSDTTSGGLVSKIPHYF